MKSIHETEMVCINCGAEYILDDCVIGVGDEGTQFGCPIEDCGGIMTVNKAKEGEK